MTKLKSKHTGNEGVYLSKATYQEPNANIRANIVFPLKTGFILLVLHLWYGPL